jgi:deoxyribodipyrimidine photo-lyase
MIELNNKYGLDGRNPNSYTVFGRYDRPWGPVRLILSKVRVRGRIKRYG